MNYVATGPRSGLTFWGFGQDRLVMIRLLDGSLIVSDDWPKYQVAMKYVGATSMSSSMFARLLTATSDKRLEDPVLLRRVNRAKRVAVVDEVLAAHGVTL